MRAAAVLRAASADVMKKASQSLLPPLPLYRRLLRAHRALPLEMRSLGDMYVKDEFRRHATADNPMHIIGFLSQWKVYLDSIEEGGEFRGQKLDMTVFEKMSNEQVGQLYELMQETKQLYKPQEAADASTTEGEDATATATSEKSS